MKVIRLAEKIEINKKANMRIGLYENSIINCKIGDVIKQDSIIGEHTKPELLNEYVLPKMLKIGTSDSKKYVNVLNGEVVQKGELLAKRSTFANIGYYEVVADHSGIVDLSKIEEGIISVYNHNRRIPIYPECNGLITKVIPEEYIEIETSTISFKLSEEIRANDTYGKFVFISKPSLEKLEYKNNIVFINCPLTYELYNEIKDEKPSLAIFPSVDAGFIIKNPILNFPIANFWGYSENTSLTPSYRNLLVKMNSKIANYSRLNDTLSFAITKKNIQDTVNENTEYAISKVGQKIVSLSSCNLFEEAKLTEIFEDECRVKYLNNKTEDICFDEVLLLC